MADGIASIKRLVGVAVSTVMTPTLKTRSTLRGRDFMLDDLTRGADHGR